MKKLFIHLLFFVFAINCACAQKLSKDEQKKLKDELKGYMSNLDGYKAKMNDIRATLDSNDAEIKRQKDDLVLASARQTQLENKISDLVAELQECHAEKDALIDAHLPTDTATFQDKKPSKGKKYVIAESAENYNPNANATASGEEKNKSVNANSEEKSGEKIAGDENLKNKNSEAAEASASANGNISQNGVTYKVQFGLYQKFSINKYFEVPKTIGYESVEGLNRYVIGSFEDENTANNFVDDVRKMGIRDAFVAKYIDGKRVYEWSKNPKYEGKQVPSSLKEALEMERKEKRARRAKVNP